MPIKHKTNAFVIRITLLAVIVGIGLGNILSQKTVVSTVFIFIAGLIIFLFINQDLSFSLFSKSTALYSILAVLIFSGSMIYSVSFIKVNEAQKNFKAVVTSDSIPTEYGSMVGLKTENGVRLKIWLPRYPEFETGNLVEANLKETTIKYGYVRGELRLLKERLNFSLFSFLGDFRRGFLTIISKTLPEPHSSFVAGTIIGKTAGIPTDVEESFRLTGLSHILAASGYNFTLLLGFLAFMMRSLSMRTQVIFSLLLIPAFAIIAGGSPPVLRAALMGGLLYFGIMAGRISAAKTALLWAAVLFLLWDPTLLTMDLSWQLSFIATWSMIYIYSLLEKKFNFSEKKSRVILTAIFASLAAQIGTMPLIAYSFGKISLVALPVNALVVVFIPAIMILGIAIGTAYLILPALGALLAIPAWFLSEYVFQVSNFFAQFNFSQMTVHYNIYQLIASYLLLLMALHFYKSKLKVQLLKQNVRY